MRKIDEANAETLRRMLAGDPVLVDVVPAGEALQGLGERHILHAGPPIGWERMCGPMRGAVAGIAVFEGWAKDLEDAEAKAASGTFRFEPNHSYDAVGPMTGMTTQSQPVLVIENRAFGNRAYCAINEGLGKVMRFGGNDAEVLARLAWLRDVLGPALGRAIRETGGIPLKPIIARGLGMGDEMHQRNVACSSLLLRLLAPALARTTKDSEALARCTRFHRPERPVLPQCGDGDRQGHHRSGARHRRLERRHRHVAQRHRLRHSRVRHRRSMVHRTGGDAGRALLPRL